MSDEIVLNLTREEAEALERSLVRARLEATADETLSPTARWQWVGEIGGLLAKLRLMKGSAEPKEEESCTRM